LQASTLDYDHFPKTCLILRTLMLSMFAPYEIFITLNSLPLQRYLPILRKSLILPILTLHCCYLLVLLMLLVPLGFIAALKLLILWGDIRVLLFEMMVYSSLLELPVLIYPLLLVLLRIFESKNLEMVGLINGFFDSFLYQKWLGSWPKTDLFENEVCTKNWKKQNKLTKRNL